MEVAWCLGLVKDYDPKDPQAVISKPEVIRVEGLRPEASVAVPVNRGKRAVVAATIVILLACIAIAGWWYREGISKAESEKKQLAELARAQLRIQEDQRQSELVEAKAKVEEADQQRKAAEIKAQVAEAEKQRMAEEASAKRQAAVADAKSKSDEAESQRRVTIQKLLSAAQTAQINSDFQGARQNYHEVIQMDSENKEAKAGLVTAANLEERVLAAAESKREEEVKKREVRTKAEARAPIKASMAGTWVGSVKTTASNGVTCPTSVFTYRVSGDEKQVDDGDHVHFVERNGDSLTWSADYRPTNDFHMSYTSILHLNGSFVQNTVIVRGSIRFTTKGVAKLKRQ
jgi:hypothetical protein